MLVRMWRKVNSPIVGGNVNWCTMENSMEVSQKKEKKIELPYDAVTPFLGI